MPSQAEFAKGPFYAELAPPFRENIDDALSNLGPGELPLLSGFVDFQKQLWPIITLTGSSIPLGESCNLSFTLPDTAGVNVLFTDAGKMYTVTAAVPGAQVFTQITVAGGSTAISADSAQGPFSVAFVNGALYFAHNGTGPLRVWAGGATYADVAAPGSGYHNGVKYKPYYLTAQNNRLIILGDAAAAVGTQYDVVGSTVTSAVDFTSFGSFYTQLLDTSDVISGGSILYGKLIVYKHDSIIVGTPSGDASAPYNFERYQQSTEQSIGVFAPYSLVNDGGFRDIFLSRYGMISFDGSQFQMIGHGVDQAILGKIQPQNVGSAPLTPAIGVLGTIYTSGTVTSVYSTVDASLQNGMNKGQRFYGIMVFPTQNSSTPTGVVLFLYNVDSPSWSHIADFNLNVRGIGTMFLGNAASDASGTDSTAQKCIIVGTSQIAVPSLPNGLALGQSKYQNMIRIGSGPAIYQFGPWRQKTVKRLGIGFQYPLGVTTTSFSITGNVYVSGANVAAGGMVQSTQAIPSQEVLPAIAGTLNVENFAWFNINLASCRSPIIEISYPSQGSSRFWPRITRMVVEYDLGDDA